jgi:hypothetical protein
LSLFWCLGTQETLYSSGYQDGPHSKECFTQKIKGSGFRDALCCLESPTSADCVCFVFDNTFVMFFLPIVVIFIEGITNLEEEP